MILSKAIEGFLIELAGKDNSQRTIALYKYDLGHLVEYLGDVEVETVTHQDLTKFMLFLKNDYRPGGHPDVVSDVVVGPLLLGAAVVYKLLACSEHETISC